MGFTADLHVHSRFSRATSRDADLEHMASWARRKGVGVVGTGDFTHPGWFRELEEKLVPAEPGLYRLRPEIEQRVEAALGEGGGSAPARFMLQVEISTIYKKAGRTRKVHHLIYVPDLERARRLIASLSRIGNLAADGRPILGLDSRDLLEITLEAGEGCYLIPAHIWTPWFAVLGSRSGFDAIEECYGDLTGAIFAVETGLSSDPPMNRRLTSLDRYRLVSNSDAHSPARIGREACAFDTELDYFAMRRALETGAGYGGTVEFFAEEGKYHLDGHRACGVRLRPEESRAHGGKCPACGKPLTLGVMHRVSELADREEASFGPAGPRYRSLVPLDEILAEIHGVGPRSRAVGRAYEALVRRLGPELFVLEEAPFEEVARASSALVAEALCRLRQGRVFREAGFDGQYGTIRLFTAGELARRLDRTLTFEFLEEAPEEASEETGATDSTSAAPARGEPLPPRPGGPPAPASSPGREAAEPAAPARRGGGPPAPASGPGRDFLASPAADILAALDPEQRAAAEWTEGPLAIIAGPGTGKTRTLTHRLAHLIRHLGAPPEACLAITFTRRAAEEMAARLAALLGDEGRRVEVRTFHSLGHSILEEHAERLGLPRPLRVATEAERREVIAAAARLPEARTAPLLERLSRRKRSLAAARGIEGDAGSELGDSAEARALALYDEELRRRGLADFDDLLALPLRLLDAHPDLAAAYRQRYRWIAVDELQDVDPVQYALLTRLAPPGGDLCVIGDPDQAIYSFRGADLECFERLRRDFPAAEIKHLTRSYRSTESIVKAALEVVRPVSLLGRRHLEARGGEALPVEVHECPTDRAEAEYVVHRIERLLGGSTFFSMDSGRVESHEGESLAFSDLAVLYRTESQADLLVEALERSGMPFQKRSHRPLAAAPAVQRVAAELAGPHAQPAAAPLPELLERAIAAVRAEEPEVELHAPDLRRLAARFPADRARFLAELALGLDADLWDPRAQGVSLLTLHAAKGLEFTVVFIVGCEDGILPLRWGALEPQALAEERRLFFVGMTRARERLILTHARRRRWRGKMRALGPSPLLEGIEDLLARSAAGAGTRPFSPFRQLQLFGDS